MRNLIDINMLNDGIARKLLQTAKFYKSSGRGLLEGAPLLGRTLAMIFEKPSTSIVCLVCQEMIATPNGGKIKIKSDIEHTMLTKKTCCFLSPCSITNKFCGPIARIKLPPVKKPKKMFSI